MPKPIDGVPVYGWECLVRLAGLASVGMLKRDRKRPGDKQKPVGQYWTGYEYHPLYKADGAVDLPPLSPGRQRLYDANRTCARCGARSKVPWEKGRDGKRYCDPCQEPAARELWDREQAERRTASAAWAREVLADGAVVLVACRMRQYWREVYAADLAGTVLLDAKVRHRQEIVPLLERQELREDVATTSGPADVLHQAVALTGRRLIAWRSDDVPGLAGLFNPEAVGRDVELRLTAAPGDDFGKRYDNFVGQLWGTSYRWHPTVAHQPSPWEPDLRVAQMRTRLAEMAVVELGELAREAADG